MQTRGLDVGPTSAVQRGKIPSLLPLTAPQLLFQSPPSPFLHSTMPVAHHDWLVCAEPLSPSRLCMVPFPGARAMPAFPHKTLHRAVLKSTCLNSPRTGSEPDFSVQLLSPHPGLPLSRPFHPLHTVLALILYLRQDTDSIWHQSNNWPLWKPHRRTPLNAESLFKKYLSVIWFWCIYHVLY